MERIIDTRGRVRIPSEIREQFCLNAGDKIELATDAKGIHLLPLENADFKTIKTVDYINIQELLLSLYKSGLIDEEYINILK